MIPRVELKEEAKRRLSRYYWKAVVVGLLGTAVGAGTNYMSVMWNGSNRDLRGISDISISPAVIMIVLGSVSLYLLFAAAISAFFTNILNVGVNRFFLNSREYITDFNEVAYGMKEGRYKNLVTVMFMRDLFVGLWSLLFIIPGIIKSYEYLMVPYILAEDPHIDYKLALQKSKDMMEGHKLDTFILSLSFIGWELLGTLMCGIGLIFVQPYISATFTELYIYLRDKKLNDSPWPAKAAHLQ